MGRPPLPEHEEAPNAGAAGRPSGVLYGPIGSSWPRRSVQVIQPPSCARVKHGSVRFQADKARGSFSRRRTVFSGAAPAGCPGAAPTVLASWVLWSTLSISGPASTEKRNGSWQRGLRRGNSGVSHRERAGLEGLGCSRGELPSADPWFPPDAGRSSGTGGAVVCRPGVRLSCSLYNPDHAGCRLLQLRGCRAYSV